MAFRWESRSRSDVQTTDVGDFVAVKASRIPRVLQLSAIALQSVQLQSLRNNKSLAFSMTCGIWFGTRGSEV